MSTRLADPRLWLPLAAGALLLGARELRRPAAPPVPPPAAAIALPVVHAPGGPPATFHGQLDLARSSVRFVLGAGASATVLACEGVRGCLQWRADGSGELDLALDLGSLVPRTGAGPDPTAHERLLGVHRGSEVAYHATLVGRATTPVPGVTALRWQGSLRFGGRVVQQAMELWQTSLPGRPLRLQGCGPVFLAAYGLQRASWFGLVQEHHVVTLGLDLAWQRSPAH